MVSSVYAPKSCSTTFLDFTDLANISVKIVYLDDKDSIVVSFVMNRSKIDGYGIHYSKTIRKCY